MPSEHVSAYFYFTDGGKGVQTPVYLLGSGSGPIANLNVGAKGESERTTRKGSIISGPAIIADTTQTIVVEPGCTAYVLSQHVVIKVGKAGGSSSADASAPSGEQAEKAESVEEKIKQEEVDVADPIMLAVFGNRFMRYVPFPTFSLHHI